MRGILIWRCGHLGAQTSEGASMLGYFVCTHCGKRVPGDKVRKAEVDLATRWEEQCEKS